MKGRSIVEVGLLREKTGSLLAPVIAHGGPDAVDEALAVLFGWQT